MPNLVNEILLDTLQREFESMGSCLVVAFHKLQPAQDMEVRNTFRDAGVRYRVVRNRLAQRAFKALNVDLEVAFDGKCGVAIAEKEGAIKAARLLRDVLKKHKEPPMRVTGGVIEGEVITGKEAEAIADMPDRDTVNTMLATAISGPARSLATAVNALAGGMARCIQARIDKAGGEPASEAAGETAGEPTIQPAGGPTTETAGQPASEPTSVAAGEPASEPSGEPTSPPAGEPTSPPAGEPGGEPTAS